jgi:hypothetical protein
VGCERSDGLRSVEKNRRGHVYRGGIRFPESGFERCKRRNAVGRCLRRVASHNAGQATALLAKIAGSTRLVVMSPTPITSQVSIQLFYFDRMLRVGCAEVRTTEAPEDDVQPESQKIE